MDYRRGMKRMAASIRSDAEASIRFERYRSQLLENLAMEEEYGSTEQIRNDRFRVVDRLNKLCSELEYEFSFTSLCTINDANDGRKLAAEAVLSEAVLTGTAARSPVDDASLAQSLISGREQRPTVSPHLPIFLQTVKDRLELITNDYSVDESLFQGGFDTPLVDLRVADHLEHQNLTRIRRARDAHVQPILRGASAVPAISIVIPVFGGGHVLAECLHSLARQTLVRRRAPLVDIVIVDDGTPAGEQTIFADSEVSAAINALRAYGVLVTCLRLEVNYGRAQARNIGLAQVRNPVVLFVDGSMILEADVLAEHVWRHARLPNVALLGFKENIDLNAFERQHAEIVSGVRKPDFRKDLKWCHRLSDDEVGDGGFSYGGHNFRSGDVINYMELSNCLKDLSGTEVIGQRTLPSFFQTNIVSAKTDMILNVGGFEPLIQGWGLEDTFLGALLVATGCHLIPCPSAVAFNLEHSQSHDPAKSVDLGLNKLKYHELLTKTRMAEYSRERFLEKVSFLKNRVAIVSTN